MHRAGAVLALLVLAGVPDAANAKIIGADDRRPEPDFDAVGRLVCIEEATGRRVQSTMTLVGDRKTVIGVGHFGQGSVAGAAGSLPLSSCTFELYGRFRARMFSSRIATVVDARYTFNPTPNVRTADWTILRLAEAAPDFIQPVKLAPIGLDRLTAAKGLFMVAYHRDLLPGARVRSPDCDPRALKGEASAFRHSCDTDLESSGGLIFRMGPNGPRGVAMNFAQSSDNYNYGKLLDPEMVRQLPKGSVDPAG